MQIEVLDVVIYKDERYLVHGVLRKCPEDPIYHRLEDEFSLVNLNTFKSTAWIKESKIKENLNQIRFKELRKVLKIMKLMKNIY